MLEHSVSRSGLLVLVLIACASPPRPAPASAPASPDAEALEAEKQLAREADTAIEHKELAIAGQKLQAAIDAPIFAKLPSDRRHALLGLAGAVAAQSRRWPEAHAFYVRATDLIEANGDDWLGRATTAWPTNDRPDLVFSLARLARIAPSALALFRDQVIFRAIGELPKTPAQEETRFQLLDALFDVRWRPATAVEPSAEWRDLTLLLLERNQMERAVQVASRVTDPYVLVAMRVDNRFAHLVSQDPGHYDIDKAQAMELERSRAAVSEQPRSLAVLEHLLGSLIGSGRYREALDLADETITRADASRVPLYDDLADHLSWIRYLRTETVKRLGRWDQAVEEQDRARRIPEGGGINVSQSINLGDLYIVLDRPREALAAVAPIRDGDVSKYGQMQLESVRHEAAIQLEDQAAAARALAWLRDHDTDADGTYQSALIEAGDLDGAAKELIKRLLDPRRRSKALLELQEFAETPSTLRMRIRRKGVESVVSRSDVRAAIAATGKIEQFHIAPQ